MKKKDIISIVIASIIFVFAAAMVYRFFFPATKDNSIMVTVPRKVSPTFDQKQVDNLNNPNLQDNTPDITPNFPDKPKVF